MTRYDYIKMDAEKAEQVRKEFPEWNSKSTVTNPIKHNNNKNDDEENEDMKIIENKDQLKLNLGVGTYEYVTELTDEMIQTLKELAASPNVTYTTAPILFNRKYYKTPVSSHMINYRIKILRKGGIIPEENAYVRNKKLCNFLRETYSTYKKPISKLTKEINKKFNSKFTTVQISQLAARLGLRKEVSNIQISERKKNTSSIQRTTTHKHISQPITISGYTYTPEVANYIFDTYATSIKLADDYAEEINVKFGTSYDAYAIRVFRNYFHIRKTEDAWNAVEYARRVKGAHATQRRWESTPEQRVQEPVAQEVTKESTHIVKPVIEVQEPVVKQEKSLFRKIINAIGRVLAEA